MYATQTYSSLLVNAAQPSGLLLHERASQRVYYKSSRAYFMDLEYRIVAP